MTATLEVAKAYPNDSGRGICRLDPDTLLHLNLSPGDVVLIEGSSTTVAKAWRAERDDWNTDTARIDGFTRQNADVSIGGRITVEKFDAKPAERVVLAPPAEAKVRFGEDAAGTVKEQILKRPVVRGDIVPVMSSTNHPFMRSPGQAIPLIATETDPVEPVLITESTDVVLREEPIESLESVTEYEPRVESKAPTASVPNTRCGFTTESLNVGSDFGHVSCIRRPWSDGRCIWHAEQKDKPEQEFEAVISDRESHAEDFVRVDGAYLQGVEFDNIDLPMCVLNHADFTGADLSTIDFTGSVLQNATLDQANVSGGIFNGVDLTDATGREVTAINVDLSGAVLTNARLPDSRFNETTFDGAYLKNTDFRNGTFDGASFEGTTLEEVNFESAQLKAVDLSGEFLDQADLSNATLPRANLSRAGLEGADLSEANLRHANLRGVALRNAKLENADISFVSASEAVLASARLTGVTAEAATFEDVDANGASFEQSTLERAVFTQADLFDAKLDGAKLYGAVLTDTRINGGTSFGDRCVYDPRFADDGDRDVRKAEWTYRVIERLSRQNALPEQARKAYIARKEVRRREHYETLLLGGTNLDTNDETVIPWTSAWNYVKATWNHHSMDHGDNPWKVVKFSLASIAICSALYPFWGIRTVDGTKLTYAHNLTEPLVLFGKSAYFSTVTFTTLGYGDVQPVGWGQSLAMFESFLGALLMALLVFVLGRRATW